MVKRSRKSYNKMDKRKRRTERKTKRKIKKKRTKKITMKRKTQKGGGRRTSSSSRSSSGRMTSSRSRSSSGRRTSSRRRSRRRGRRTSSSSWSCWPGRVGRKATSVPTGARSDEIKWSQGTGRDTGDHGLPVMENPKTSEFNEVFRDLYILEPYRGEGGEGVKYRMLEGLKSKTDLGGDGNGSGYLTYREVQNLEDNWMVALDAGQYEKYGEPALQGVKVSPLSPTGNVVNRKTDLGKAEFAAYIRNPDEYMGRLPDNLAPPPVNK